MHPQPSMDFGMSLECNESLEGPPDCFDENVDTTIKQRIDDERCSRWYSGSVPSVHHLFGGEDF